ncbi:hypothetical protein L6V77_11710 [Myxococcota bacterium]|nr:hypothetical protein [Myxococcota bacterium]
MMRIDFHCARLVLVAWSLTACGESGTSTGSPAIDAGTVDADTPLDARPTPAPRDRFQMPDGTEVEVGPATHCPTRFCTARAEERSADATVLFVDADAASGGDGSEERPFRTLADALATEGALEVRLGPGRYACPGRWTRPVTLVGAGAGVTSLETAEASCLDVDGVPFAAAVGLSMSGADTVVRVRDAARFRLRDVELAPIPEGPGTSAVGLRLEAVGTAEVLGSRLSGHTLAQLVVIDSGVVVRETRLGPGPGAGLLAGPPAATPASCAQSRSPVCPFAAFVQLEDSEILGTGERGLEAAQSIVRLRRVRVAELESPEDRAIGVHAVQSHVTTHTALLVDAIRGRGLAALSSRGHLQAVNVTQASSGGVEIDRLPPVDAPEALRLRPFPVDPDANGTGPLYPEPQIRPPAEWSSFPEAFAGIADYPEPQIHPGAPWFSDATPLPEVLRAETAVPRPAEIDLHRWARIRLDAPVIADCGRFGLRLAGHASTINAPRITGTRGADSTALLVTQRESAAVEDDGASVVALSEIHDLDVASNEGDGVALLRPLLQTRADGPPRAFPDRRLPLAGGAVAGNTGRGLLAVEGTLNASGLRIADNRGIGLWVVGAFATVAGNDIADTLAGPLTGRAGAFDAGYGLVLQGSDRWSRDIGNALDVRENSIRGSADGGILFVLDTAGLGGRVDLDQTLIHDNGAFDAARIGEFGELATSGDVEVQSVTPDLVPPPALPGE